MSFFYIPELDRPTIARFFLQQYTCQVSSIQMTLERLNESFKADESVSVDCPRASLIHRYQQGDMVRLGKYNKGRLSLNKCVRCR